MESHAETHLVAANHAARAPSASAKRIVEWQQETARIHYLGPTGKDHVFDPVLTASHEILYDHFGNALKLDKSQMSDNRFDKAPKWASDTGSAVVYFPQRLAAMLMKTGKPRQTRLPDARFKPSTTERFSEKPPHWRDEPHVFKPSQRPRPYRVERCEGHRVRESIRHGGEAPMGAAPTILIAPTNFRMRGTQITSAEWFTDVLNGAAASAQNAFKAAFDFEPPIFAEELNDDAVANTWYLAVPADQDAFDGALGLWEREAFAVNTFQPASSWELAQRKSLSGKTPDGLGHSTGSRTACTVASRRVPWIQYISSITL